jgi:Big-like domain-containing protein/hemolysin type calcium-binding protein
MVRRAAVVIALVLAVPAAAQAADVSVSSGVLRYAATAAHKSNATFTEGPPGVVTITRGDKDDDPLTPGSGCVAGPPVVCSGVTSAVIDAGDGADRITAGALDDHGNFAGLAVPAAITGGEGNDALAGGSRDNVIDGGAGDDEIDSFQGNDSLSGGDGNDVITPNTGTDGISGGDGIDTVVYGYRTSPSYTLDGQSNDGDSSEKDTIGADVENVSAAAFGNGLVAIAGDGRANRLTVTDGRGEITGADGSDVLEGGPLDDVIHARDGAPDTIICNGGNDTVEADTLDTVSPSCENVVRVPVPGGTFDDRPPSLSWTFPGAGASLNPNAATILKADASDDRGVARVQFIDDDRLLCEVSAPPYQCAYAPRGEDVGRDTLLIVAIDGANQTTTALRVVTVRRFTPAGLSLSLSSRRDRRKPYSFRATGRLARPSRVAARQGCSGTVTITAKRGKKSVYTRHARLSRGCHYRVTLHPGSRKGKLRLSARFGGSAVLAGRTSATHTIRLG